MSKHSLRHAVIESEERSLETIVCERCGYEYPRLVGDECPNCGYFNRPVEIFDNPGKRWVVYLYNYTKRKIELLFGTDERGRPGWMWANRYSMPYAATFPSKEAVLKRIGKYLPGGSKYMLIVSDGYRKLLYTEGRFERVGAI